MYLSGTCIYCENTDIGEKMMLKVVKDVKGSMEAKDYNDAMGDFWQEVENLTVFEEKKEKISYATNCFPLGTVGCC